MKKYVYIFVAFLLMSCGIGSNQEQISGETMYVNEYIVLPPEGSKIVVAKLCHEDSKYEYIYQLQSGVWIASNEALRIGDYLGVTSVDPPKPVIKEEKEETPKLDSCSIEISVNTK